MIAGPEAPRTDFVVLHQLYYPVHIPRHCAAVVAVDFATAVVSTPEKAAVLHECLSMWTTSAAGQQRTFSDD